MIKDRINGENGKTPEFQMSGNKLQWKYSTDITWIDLLTFPDFTEYAKKTDFPDLSGYAKKEDIPEEPDLSD